MWTMSWFRRRGYEKKKKNSEPKVSNRYAFSRPPVSSKGAVSTLACCERFALLRPLICIPNELWSKGSGMTQSHLGTDGYLSIQSRRSGCKDIHQQHWPDGLRQHARTTRGKRICLLAHAPTPTSRHAAAASHFQGKSNSQKPLNNRLEAQWRLNIYVCSRMNNSGPWFCVTYHMSFHLPSHIHTESRFIVALEIQMNRKQAVWFSVQVVMMKIVYFDF